MKTRVAENALITLVLAGLLWSGNARAAITLHDGSIFSTNMTGAGVQTIPSL